MSVNSATRGALAVLRLVSGVSIVRQAASAVADLGDGVRQLGDRLGSLWSLARRPVRRETFAEAVSRLSLAEQDLVERERQIRLRADIWLLVYMVAGAIACAAPLVASPMWHLANSALLAAVAAAGWMRWEFRAAQIDRRELIGFGEWFRSSESVRALARRSVIAALVVCAGLTAAAYAAGPDLRQFTPAPGDSSVGFLREVFGPVIDHIWSGAANSKAENLGSPLGAMLAPFNAGVLFLGMVFVLYTTIKGTIDSAHDGEVLGRKMSEIWVPIRTVGGAALIMPAVGGYSLIQVAVLWLAVQSVGLANAVLNSGLDLMGTTGMVSTPHVPNSRSLAAQILRSETCAAAMNRHWEAAGVPTRIVLSRGNGWDLRWTARNGPTEAYIAADVCGAIEFQDSHETAEGNSNVALFTAAQILVAQRNAIAAMIIELRPTAQALGAASMPPKGAVERAAIVYENSLAAAAKVAVQQTSNGRRAQFLDAVRAGGWVYLPTYYNQMIQQNDLIQSAINALPVTRPVTIDQIESDVALITFQDSRIALNEYLRASAVNVLGNGEMSSPAAERRRQFAQDSEFPTSWSDAKRLLSGFAMVGLAEMTETIAGSNLSHIGQIKAVGDTLIAAGETGTAAMFMASGVAGSNAAKVTIGNVFSSPDALATLQRLLSTGVLALIVFGVIAAYYVPLIPYIAGVLGVIKWLTLVFEAVIAAPIWAVAHIHPDGHEVVGKGEAGYMLIIALMLRPALMVLGFFGSIWLAQPVAGYINASFMTAVQGAEHESLTGLVAFVSYAGIYVLLMVGVMHSVFTLINWVPDNTLRWIGSSLQAHGVGDTEGGAAEHGFRGGVVNISTGLRGSADPRKGAATTGKATDEVEQAKARDTNPEDHFGVQKTPPKEH